MFERDGEARARAPLFNDKRNGEKRTHLAINENEKYFFLNEITSFGQLQLSSFYGVSFFSILHNFFGTVD